MLRRGGDPDAHCDGADLLELQRCDPFDDRFCRDQSSVLVGGREQQRELVAAETEGLACLTQARRELRQHAVARRMAEAIVDPLEVVDVDQAEAERETTFVRVPQLPLKAFVEVPVVAEAGQRIRQGQPHGPEGADDRTLVELDREQGADERHGQERGALPEHDQHQRGRGHQRERDDRPADVRAREREDRAARAHGDDRRDQDQVDDVLG